MEFPHTIATVLAGYHSTGANLKTASASNVYRYVHPDSGRSLFVKIQGPSWSPPLSRERDAMDWLLEKLRVPEVLAYCREDDTEYLVTTGLYGISSEHRECHIDKRRLIEQLADSLRAIHDIPISDCPLDRIPATLIERGRQRIRSGVVTQKMIEDEGLTGSPDEALSILERRAPALVGPVFTHGDYCLPNVMIFEDEISGFIDLGYAGLGDPYRDFIAAQYSIRRNLGEEWAQPFFDAYGVESLDESRLQWYRQIQAFD